MHGKLLIQTSSSGDSENMKCEKDIVEQELRVLEEERRKEQGRARLNKRKDDERPQAVLEGRGTSVGENESHERYRRGHSER